MSRTLRRSVSLAFAACSVGWGAYWLHHVQNQSQARAERARFKQVGQGQAEVGAGDFVLVDARNGMPVSKSDVFVHATPTWNLVYFGYTFCPDICPAELRRITNVLHRADNDGIAVQPYFISIDPQRDTVGQMRRYLAEFHPRIVGLTGTPRQLADVARQYRIYSFRSGDATNLLSDDYLVDHSIFMLLVNPEGKFVDYYGSKLDLEEVYQRFSYHVKDFERTRGKQRR